MPYAINRLSWTMDWVQDEFDSQLDPERVFAIGSSMGGIGTMRLIEERPESFAAALSRHGNYDLSLRPPISLPDRPSDILLLDSLFGDPALGLDVYGTSPPENVYERLNSALEVARDPDLEWPFLRTIQGQYDYTVGWGGVPDFYRAMQMGKRAGAHYFDNKGHFDTSPWNVVGNTLEAALIARTLEHTLSEPVLHFGEFDLDTDFDAKFCETPPFGDPWCNDQAGAVSGYADWTRGAVSYNNPVLTFDEVFLHSNPAPDAHATLSEGKAALTPRRAEDFQANLSEGEIVKFQLLEGGVLKDEHLIFVEDDGIATTPPSPLIKNATRTAIFEHDWSPTQVQYLFVGDMPFEGEELQIVVFGNSGESWAIDVSENVLPRIWTRLETGTLTGTTFANLVRPVPPGAQSDEEFVFQMIIAGATVTGPTITIQ